MQATRFQNVNPKLKINTHVKGSAAPPEVVFKFIDDTEVSLLFECCMGVHVFLNFAFLISLQKRFDSQSFNASEILFEVHLALDRLDNEFEMSGKSIDDE